ncbi:carbon-nitrogen hydrolase family protein [Primorskyibacter sp. S87]|uniref:carbon-nitrogen hydrolase family protein n=1 Tax=Primorskyibacter sp. S87 TaxID=3415126 RepID=UPI003C7E8ACB
MNRFRLSVAQSPAGLKTSSDRLGWLRAKLPGIAANKADLVLLPELFACGYNIGDEVERCAEHLDGPSFAAISNLAREFGVAIHYGFAERAKEGIFNSAVCASPTGQLLGHQRKLAIPPGFERSYFTPGTGCNLFDYGGLRIATLICYDAEFPETVRHVTELGAELVLVPTALGSQWSWVAHSLIPSRAYENGVYLAYANSVGEQGDTEFLGASVISAPDGIELARAGRDPEIIHAELDKARLVAARRRLPYLEDLREIRF